MANSKRKCGWCKEYGQAADMFINGLTAYCNREHYIEAAVKKLPKIREGIARKNRVANTSRKMAMKPRSYWYACLQAVINQWVVHVRDKGKPCITCGTQKQTIKYDAGHFIHAGSGGANSRRFYPININKQCSVNCNGYGSGMRLEYRVALVGLHGEKAVSELEGPQPNLKEQFPHIDDIKAEVVRYKIILRAHGLEPRRI